jgi:hypothetical protein
MFILFLRSDFIKKLSNQQRLKLAKVERKTTIKEWFCAAILLMLGFTTALFGAAIALLFATEGESAFHTLERLWHIYSNESFEHAVHLAYHSLPTPRMLDMPLFVQHAQHSFHQNLCKVRKLYYQFKVMY